MKDRVLEQSLFKKVPAGRQEALFVRLRERLGHPSSSEEEGALSDEPSAKRQKSSHSRHRSARDDRTGRQEHTRDERREERTRDERREERSRDERREERDSGR